MSNLTNIVAPLTIVGSLAAGSAYGEDYLKVNKFLGWETTTVTRTQPGVVLRPQQVIYRDACGNSCQGTGYTPVAAEIITGRCTTVHWKARDSIPGRAIGLIEGIGNELGKALSPRPATARPCIPYGRCAPTVPYCAPAPTVAPLVPSPYKY